MLGMISPSPRLIATPIALAKADAATSHPGSPPSRGAGAIHIAASRHSWALIIGGGAGATVAAVSRHD